MAVKLVLVIMDNLLSVFNTCDIYVITVSKHVRLSKYYAIQCVKRNKNDFLCQFRL